MSARGNRVTVEVRNRLLNGFGNRMTVEVRNRLGVRLSKIWRLKFIFLN